jgi:carboxypeptidase Taq
MSVFEELMAYQRETEALGEVMGRLGWDMETMMPEGAAEQRAEEMAAMDGVLHARRSNPKIGEWIAVLEGLEGVEGRQVDLIRRVYEQTVKVPAELSAALTRAETLGQQAWINARKDNDFEAFAPHLQKILDLTCEKADALSDGGTRYDALLQLYEPRASGAGLEAMFGALRPRLVALRERILGSARQVPELTGEFAEDAQLRISTDLAKAFGYDLAHGRIDKAVHPFSSGSGLDVRITTRTDLARPFDCFYSTVHEVGHAAYEQNIDRAYLLTPLGDGVSMGVHESQSRIYENQIGRSRAFTSWLFKRMQSEFGDFGIADADAFYAAVNRVAPGYIRTEADEVHYNLHVLLRFDLERKLVAGELSVADLPEAWNARFEADFGVAVDKPANGVLQDVHWSSGAIGYFPTYTLGNVYAGCLHAALRRDVPDLDAALAEGDTSPATEWLKAKVQTHGGRFEAVDVIAQATEETPGEGPLLDYLEAKFGDIYAL